MFEQHPLLKPRLQTCFATYLFRDAFSFPGLLCCWTGADFFQAASLHNDKRCFCMPQCRKRTMRFKRGRTGGSLNRACAPADKAWRTKPEGQDATAEAWRAMLSAFYRPKATAAGRRFIAASGILKKRLYGCRCGRFDHVARRRHYTVRCS